MGYSSGQLSVANSLPASESAQFLGSKSKPLETSLFIETVLVTTTAVLAIKILAASSACEATWFVTPGILVAATLIPILVKRSRVPKIGFNIEQVSHSLVLLGWTCVVIFPALFVGLCLLRSYGLEFPLRPVLPQGQGWVCWLFYQFMYVAVAEEVFFRGYLQSNILKLASTMVGGRCSLAPHQLNHSRGAAYRLPSQVFHWRTIGAGWISIVISAACFAVAHIIVQGQVISVLTFLPGVVLGWLFIQTRSLLAPILFHGLANSCYTLMAAMLA